MNYQEIKNICRQGKIGMIPKWIGYLKWNYSKNLLEFINEDYVMTQSELEDKLLNRNDLYYII